MSSIVSRRPSSRNHWNEAFWMSIRLGRSRTCGRWEKDLRARGEATLVVKKSGLPMDWRVQAKVGVQTGRRAGRRRNQPGYRKRRSHRKQKPRRAPNSDRQRVAPAPGGRKPVGGRLGWALRVGRGDGGGRLRGPEVELGAAQSEGGCGAGAGLAGLDLDAGAG